MILEQEDLNRMLETAVATARLAGRYAMQKINHVTVSIKNGNEIVTEADGRCQQIIVERIKESYPDHGFIAEEGGKEKIFKQQPRGTKQFWWVIDPIDGTHNFAHGIFSFTVSIAVIHEDRPIVGVIFDPAADLMFSAVEGGKAKLNSELITASEETINEYSSVAMDSDFANGVPAWVCRIMQQTRFRNLGTSALELAYVASGGLVAVILSSPKLWDIAAGAIIAQAGGAIISTWKGDKIFPVDMNKYHGQQFPTIAANKKTHPILLELINS